MCDFLSGFYIDWSAPLSPGAGSFFGILGLVLIFAVPYFMLRFLGGRV